MNAYVTEGDIDNFETADISLTYFFSLFDIFILAISFYFIKSRNETSKMLKQKLLTLLAIDIIMRLLFIRTYYHAHTLYKEIFFSGMASSQFLLILLFLEQIINDNQILSEYDNENNTIRHLNPYELSFLFFLFIFSYDKFSYSFSRHLCFLQSIINIGCIFKLYEYLRDIVSIIVENISHADIQKGLLYSFIKNLPLSSLEFFVAYYILKIVSLFIENTLYLIYIKIIIIILKETSKYFVIFILGAILYIMNKDKVEKAPGANNDENANINNK